MFNEQNSLYEDVYIVRNLFDLLFCNHFKMRVCLGFLMYILSFSLNTCIIMADLFVKGQFFLIERELPPGLRKWELLLFFVRVFFVYFLTIGTFLFRKILLWVCLLIYNNFNVLCMFTILEILYKLNIIYHI